MNRLKTILWGILLLVLQITLVNLLSIKGVKPDLLILFVALRGLLEGPTRGIVWGFGTGLVLDGISGGTFGLGALAYSLNGFICGHIGRERLITRIRLLIAFASGALISYLIFLYFCEPWDQIGFYPSLIKRSLPGILYTWCLGLFWMISPFCRVLNGKYRG